MTTNLFASNFPIFQDYIEPVTVQIGVDFYRDQKHSLHFYFKVSAPFLVQFHFLKGKFSYEPVSLPVDIFENHPERFCFKANPPVEEVKIRCESIFVGGISAWIT